MKLGTIKGAPLLVNMLAKTFSLSTQIYKCIVTSEQKGCNLQFCQTERIAREGFEKNSNKTFAYINDFVQIE